MERAREGKMIQLYKRDYRTDVLICQWSETLKILRAGAGQHDPNCMRHIVYFQFIFARSKVPDFKFSIEIRKRIGLLSMRINTCHKCAGKFFFTITGLNLSFYLAALRICALKNKNRNNGNEKLSHFTAVNVPQQM